MNWLSIQTTVSKKTTDFINRLRRFYSNLPHCSAFKSLILRQIFAVLTLTEQIIQTKKIANLVSIAQSSL